ncbi:hypothetical protein FKM82_007292 [Ascaphus truei]
MGSCLKYVLLLLGLVIAVACAPLSPNSQKYSEDAPRNRNPLYNKESAVRAQPNGPEADYKDAEHNQVTSNPDTRGKEKIKIVLDGLKKNGPQDIACIGCLIRILPTRPKI